MARRLIDMMTFRFGVSEIHRVDVKYLINSRFVGSLQSDFSIRC